MIFAGYGPVCDSAQFSPSSPPSSIASFPLTYGLFRGGRLLELLRLAFVGLNKIEVCGHTQKTCKRSQPIEDSVPGWTWPSENMIQGLAE